MECAKMLIVHLNENMLSEDMTFDIAYMFMTYLAKSNLSTESINELQDEADKVIIATAIQKFIMRPVTEPWIRRRTEGESTESTDAKPGSLRSWRREIRTLEEFNVAMFGDYRRAGRRRHIVHEIDVDNENEDYGWYSDDDDDQEEEKPDYESNCGILNNTIFNLD